MKKCEWCGKWFDAQVAEEEFSIEVGSFAYSNFSINLCGECAIQAINDEVDGSYFESCEKCGKTFDYFDAVGDFIGSNAYRQYGDYADYCGGLILCPDCAEENAG